MATTTREIVHVRRLLADFDVFLTAFTPLTCDSKSAVKIATNPIFHERMKHTEIDCYFTRHHFNSGTISLSYNCLEDQIADFFTKSHTTSINGQTHVV